MHSTLDFTMAITKHLSWKVRLRSFLDGKEALTLAQATSHKDCDLGKWMYAEGIEHYKAHGEMHELERIHQTLHALVKSIIQHKTTNQMPQAEAELAQVDMVSKRIVELLKVLEAKTNG